MIPFFNQASCCNGEVSAFINIYRIYSATGYYIYLQQNKDDTLTSGSLHNFTVYYTIKDLDFSSTKSTFYYIVSNVWS